MIHVIVRERDATAQATEPITSGSVGLECSFRFSEDWEGLGKVAIFQGSGQIIDVALVGQESCTVPHEVLQQALGHLKIGVYGTGEQGQRVTPTIWADAGRILPGVEPSEIEPTPATQSLVQQILEAAENAEELAQSVRDDADAGEFDGEPGPKGDKGDPGESGLAYYRAIVSSAGTLTMQADMPSPTEIANTFNTGAGPLPLLRLHDQGWFFNDTETFARIYLDLRYSQRHQTGAKYAVFEGTFENRDGSGPCHIWVKGIEANGSTTWTIGKEALGGGDSGAAYFPFSISDSTVTPGTGVTPQAIYQAYTAGKAVFAVIEPELEIDDDQILPLTWINELSGTYSIWFSVVNGHVSFDLIFSADTWHTQSETLYQKPSTGIPKSDLASAIRTSLGKADTALQSYTETDPTVPSWAKASSKPSYTASEVGALPASTVIPSKTSDLSNDSGFVNASGAAAAAPVQSVNGQTGAVTVQPATDAQVTSAVNTWLGNNIAQETGYALDASLTMSNAAAPADKVGELKSALDDVYDNNGVPAQNLTISDFTSQDCYKTNGESQVFGLDWVSTEFIPCYGSVVKYKGYAFYSVRSDQSINVNLAVVAFFDVYKQMTHCIASTDVLSAPGNGVVSGEVSAQPGDYYVRVISYTSRVPDSYVVVSAGNLYSKLSVVDGLADAVGVSGIEIGYNSFTSDQILRENGTFQSYGEPWRSTDYISCFGAKSVQYTATPFHGNGVNLVAYVAFFDRDKNLISFLDSSSFPSGYHVNQTGSADVPQNAYYVRIVGQDSNCRLSIEATGLEQFTDFKASDLKILCIGDSLTRGVINTDVDIIRESYPYWVGKTLSSYAANAGYPGGVPRTWWARRANYEQPTADTDLVLIMFGTNGELTQNTLATDVEPYTDYADYADTSVGCYCKIIEWIMEQTSNHAQIILMTPPMPWPTTGDESYARGKYNTCLNSLPVIRAIAERYALPVIDVFYGSGMNKYNGSVFRPNDGIHFGAKGYHKLGTFIARQVASMYSTFDVDETGTVIS